MFRSRFSADNSDKMSADSTKTKISMKSFYIYNSTLCPREGEVSIQIAKNLNFAQQFLKFPPSNVIPGRKENSVLSSS